MRYANEEDLRAGKSFQIIEVALLPSEACKTICSKSFLSELLVAFPCNSLHS